MHPRNLVCAYLYGRCIDDVKSDRAGDIKSILFIGLCSLEGTTAFEPNAKGA